jgi:hypothetical protein
MALFNNPWTQLNQMPSALSGLSRGIESGMGLARQAQEMDLQAEEAERVRLMMESMANIDYSTGKYSPEVLAMMEADPEFAQAVMQKKIASQLSGKFAPDKWQKDVDSEGYFVAFSPLSKKMERVLDDDGKPIKKGTAVKEYISGDQVILVNSITGEEITRFKVDPEQTKTPGYQAAVETAKTEAGMKASGAIPLTPAQKKVDESFATEYVKFTTGEFADAEKNISQLEEVEQALQGTSNLTGPAVSIIPDFVKAFGMPETISTREAVEEVVQRNLRLVLGAQFTEKEGEKLIARAYNPKLSEAENLKRVRRLLKSMKDAIKAKKSAAEYFEKNGTLKGYNRRLINSQSQLRVKGPTPEDIDKMSKEELEAYLGE